MTLANRITILRILLIPVFIITLIEGYYPWPVLIFSFSCITDALDGFVARYRKQITPLGSFLDPMADKFLMFSSYLLCSYLKIIPTWVFVVILSRDLLIVLGWAIIYFITGSTEIKPRLLGKLTAIIQMFTMWVILLGIVPQMYITGLLYLTILITSLSGFDYIYIGSRKLNRNA
jgi:cardiolipin synthase (CMP-forming)